MKTLLAPSETRPLQEAGPFPAIRMTQEETPTTPSGPREFDVHALIKDERFGPSSVETERDCFTGEWMPVLEDYATADTARQIAYDNYSKMADLCVNGDGLVVLNPILNHLDALRSIPERIYDKALVKLDDTITADVVCCITEALELAGVTEKNTIFEICRCVIKGGTMWDGAGFSQNGNRPLGAAAAAETEERIAA